MTDVYVNEIFHYSSIYPCVYNPCIELKCISHGILKKKSSIAKRYTIKFLLPIPLPVATA